MQATGLQVDEVAVLVGDRLGAQLAALARPRAGAAARRRRGSRWSTAERVGRVTPAPRTGSGRTTGLRPSVTGTGPTGGDGSGVAPGSSTSIVTISGAASWMACSTACWSVTADDGQPSQLPSSRSSTAPASRRCRAARRRRRAGRGTGRTLVERRLDPGRRGVGVEAVDEQQAGHQLVGDQPVEHRGRPSPTSSTTRASAAAVQVGDQAQQLLGPVAGRPRVGGGPRARRAAARCGRRPPGGRGAASVVAVAPPSAGQLGVRHLRGRVQLLQHLALAEVHVDAAGQAGVEAAHGAHDVDALEVLDGRSPRRSACP